VNASPTEAQPSPIKGPLVVIVGPTAVGKTEIALRLGEALNGEVVSADSRQVYRGMDIGTAKPTPEEQAQVLHHLIDIIAPDEPFSLGQYQELAYAAIDDILERGRLPLLVGGTGQYVWAVVEGWGIPRVPPQPELRAELEQVAEREGATALHERLRALDPVAAARIDPRNVRRVIRALEVCLITGQPISAQQRKSPPPYRILIIGLTRPRSVLYARIDARVEQMIAAGLVDEVQRLLQAGYSPELPSMSSLGYREIAAYLQGEISLEEAVARIKREPRRFVRQQGTWFRRDDPRIRWFDLEETRYEEIERAVKEFLALSEAGGTPSPGPLPSPDPHPGRHGGGSSRRGEGVGG